MLTLTGIRKNHGGRCLFSDVHLQVNHGDRIGVVGSNGAGKTTLFNLVLGVDSPDEGTLSLSRGVRVGFLPQESAPVGDETVLELALSMNEELTRLCRLLGVVPARGLVSDPTEAQDWKGRFDELDGHRWVARARRILRGLAFREADDARPARSLSGGWVMRAHLARLLVQEPELLLLDEPTNHLDLETLLWFQDHLQAYPGALLFISHDREFLNRLAGSIVEIRQGRVERYRGHYDDYLAQRSSREQQQLAAWKNQQREIERLQRFVDRFGAKNTKATQAQSKLKQIERMDLVEAPAAAEATVGFAFPQPERSGLRVVTLRGIHHAYGETVVYRGADFEVERGQRIVLVGPNGAGKSTLLKIMAGVVQPNAGEVNLGLKVRRGYFAQHRLETLHPERTVLEEALDTPQPLGEQRARTVLGSFLFRGDDVFKRVAVLSGGEKSRLALVKLLLDPPNLLLLDEPTTHLDLASTESLIQALRPYEGTIILISHDVFFIRAVARRVVHVVDGRLTAYAGDYDYYLERRARDEAAQIRPAQTAAQAAPRPVDLRRELRRQEAERRQTRSRQLREQRTLVSRLEQEIHALEARQSELTRAMEDPTTYQEGARALEVQREFEANLGQLEELTARWEGAAGRLVDLEQD